MLAKSLDDLDGPVIITMVTVGVMEVSLHQIVDMVAMGHSFVTTTWTVNVVWVVPVALVIWCTHVRVGFGHFDNMFLDLVFTTGVMKVTLVQVVYMTIVLDGRVTTTWSVLVFMSFVLCAVHV